MQDLANAVEEALRVRARSGNYPISIFTGQGDYTKTTPSLVVSAESGQEDPPNSGNFFVTVECSIRFPADTEELADHRELASNVLGLFMDSNLASLMSEENEGLAVQGIRNRQLINSIDGNQWLSTLRFDAYACVLDLT